MSKICTEPDCLKMVFSHLKCRDHQWKRTDSKWMARLANQEAKKKEKKPAIKEQTRIRPQAKKRKQERSEYSILREEFFLKEENKMCRVYPKLEATDIHHMWGTENKRLLMVEYWLPVSRKGHDYIDDHPEEAFEKGWSYYRNQDIEKQINK